MNLREVPGYPPPRSKERGPVEAFTVGAFTGALDARLRARKSAAPLKLPLLFIPQGAEGEPPRSKERGPVEASRWMFLESETRGASALERARPR